MYGGKKKMQVGGAKPDYLDFDKDGNKKESMKSALASKKKMQKGGKAPSDSTKTKKPLATNYPGGPNNPFVDEMSVIKKNIKKKPAAKNSKPAPKKMGGAKKMMYKSGGFLEMPVFDLDRD
jgi:hypothetical protein